MTKLRCFLHYGAGDLFDAKQFILEWCRIVGVTTCELACQVKFHAIFQDVPNVQCVTLTKADDPGRGIYQVGDTLFVNCWIGRLNCQGGEGYVLWPGPGCVLEKIHEMHSDLAREIGLPNAFNKSLIEYIPRIDFTRVPLGNIHEFLNTRHGQKLVLVSNGVTTSKHASNFAYSGLLDYLPQKDGVLYLFTERFGGYEKRTDVYFTDDLTLRGNGCDLNAIGYLSQFCDVMIGRCSGGIMFCQHIGNWMDSTKTLVCFVHHRNGACFIRYPEALGLKMKALWSPATDAKSAAEVIQPLL